MTLLHLILIEDDANPWIKGSNHYFIGDNSDWIARCMVYNAALHCPPFSFHYGAQDKVLVLSILEGVAKFNKYFLCCWPEKTNDS